MALNEKAAPADEEKDAPTMPALPLGVIYFVSLAALFFGERFGESPTIRYALTGIGLVGLVGSTALRFAAAQKGDVDRRSAERSLAVFSAVGLFAVGLYFTTTDFGKNALGIAAAAPDTRARIVGALTALWITLLVAGIVPLAFGELALAPMRRAARIEARRVDWAIRSGMVLAFAAAYCALLTYAAGELEVKIDFSYFRTSRASESTKKVAASATEPIEVTAFFPQLNEVGTEVQGYLRELGNGAPNLKIATQDRLLVPSIAKEQKVTSDGVIVLRRGTSRETVNVGVDMKTAQAKLKTLDVDFQKALLKVLRQARTAYFTVGHGELNEPGGDPAPGRTAKSIKKLLESQNYVVKDLGLAQGLGTEIPNDATVVVALGPTKPLLPEELAALKRYADKGGHLLFALDPDAKIDHDPVAAVVGLTWSKVTLANDRVYLPHRRNPSDRSILVTNRLSSHAAVSTLSRNSAKAQLIFPYASSLEKKEGAEGKIDFAVKSLSDTFADANGDFAFQKEEKRSAYNLAAAVSKPAAGSPEPPKEKEKGKDKDKGKAADSNEMRAFVVADVDCFSDAALPNESNALFTVDVFRWLGGEESFSGSISTPEDVRIEHTKQGDQLWFYGTVFCAPGLVLGLGFVVLRKKDKKKARRKERKERSS
jgi:hypothetical protein